MIIIENTTEFHLENKSAVALGKFDGIHLGHRRLLDRVLEQKKSGLQTVVFTFDTSAASFFGGETKELSTREEKRDMFARLGVDVLIEFPLNRETAATDPADFVTRYLAGQMRTAYLCAGSDISFGKGGAGDYALLADLSETCGYRVELIDKVRVDGEEVSSTRVRQAVRAELGEKTYRGISNVGYKPTVSEEKVLGVETYLYDFTGEVYDRDMTVALLSFRRAERAFENVEALRRQIEADVEAGRNFS